MVGPCWTWNGRLEDWLVGAILNKNAPGKFNVEPKNDPIEREKHLPSTSFQPLIFRGFFCFAMRWCHGKWEIGRVDLTWFDQLLFVSKQDAMATNIYYFNNNNNNNNNNNKRLVFTPDSDIRKYGRNLITRLNKMRDTPKIDCRCCSFESEIH